MKALFSYLIMLCLLIPSGKAHAGFFSFITDAFAQTVPDQNSSSTPPSVQNSQNVPLLEATGSPDPKATSGSNVAIDNSALVAETGPAGNTADVNDAPSPTDQISVYVVHAGDTIEQIAAMFNVSVNTIRYANDLKKGQALAVGDTLLISPVTGAIYTVKKGDTLASIAKHFKLTDSSDIQAFNGITEDTTLSIGQTLIVPGVDVTPETPVQNKPKSGGKGSGSLPSSPSSSQGSAKGYYIRPLSTDCPLTQGRHDTYAVDMSCHEVGTTVRAAADGTVIFAHYGWNGAYGNLIIIRHPNDTQTFYAHLSKIRVNQGDTVSQGDDIGNVGDTGRSTGPHLHFEVRGARNPGFDESHGINSWKK